MKILLIICKIIVFPLWLILKILALLTYPINQAETELNKWIFGTKTISKK